MKCREIWSRVKSLQAPAPIEQSPEESTPEPTPTPHLNGSSNDISKKSKKQKALEAAAKDAAAHRAAKLEAAEEELADLSNLLPKSHKPSKKHQPVIFRDDDSDFGEETHISTRAAAEKAQKKKSLRFYTSQIAQKSNRRADAGREAGGDLDVPYKERIKDRQARLNAEAEKRGKKLDEYGRGADLGGASDEEDTAAAKEVNGEEDEYYDMVSQMSKKKKAEKTEKYDAIKQAKAENAIVRVVEGEVDEDGKRAIGYVIEKNKGLAPKRKKDVRNPRVKKRKKYEEKKKKLASTRAVYKGGEERGGYGGEKTGIKTGLVKSVKL
jgi:U3 small nucleolar RNA-associated protein 3